MLKDKQDTCLHHHINLKDAKTIEHLCNQSDTLEGPFETIENKETCEKCPRYKNRFIEFPLTIDQLDIQSIEPSTLYADRIGSPCAIRLAGNDPKTYIGIFLGELPYQIHASVFIQNNTLSCYPLYNPAILVPELKRIVYGYESWWKTLESPEDFKEITGADIQSQWYVQMFQHMMKGESTDESDC